MGYIIVLAMIQSLFLGLLLISKKKRSFSDIILALWLFVIGLNCLYYFYTLKFYPASLKYMGYNIGAFYLYVILLYIYAHSLVSVKMDIKKYWKHFLWIPLAYLSYIPLFILSTDEIIRFTQKKSNDYIHINIIITVNLILICFYLVKTVRVVMLYNKHKKEEFSSFEKNNISWIIYLLAGQGLMFFFSIGMYIIYYNLNLDLSFARNTLIFGFMLYIFGMGYFGFRQGRIFVHDDSFLTGTKKPEQKDKREKEGTPEDRDFSHKLKAEMEDKKYYLDNELTLQSLAKEMKIGPHYLSFVINQVLYTSFYDFVNGYRVEDVKMKIKKGEHIKYTLLSIAIDCGFNSKSSFNRLFKKHTGLTPSAYITNQKKSNLEKV